jgi:hypothetical protein
MIATAIVVTESIETRGSERELIVISNMTTIVMTAITIGYSIKISKSNFNPKTYSDSRNRNCVIFANRSLCKNIAKASMF